MSKAIFLILVILSTTVTTTPTEEVEGEGKIGLLDPSQILRRGSNGSQQTTPNHTSLTKIKHASTGGLSDRLQEAQPGKIAVGGVQREYPNTTVPSLHLHTTRKVLNEPRDWEQAKADFHNKFDAEKLPNVMLAKPDEFVSIGELGKGAFGMVSKVQKKSNGQVYAVKTLQVTDDNDDELVTELKLLYALDSKYITKLRYYSQDDDLNVFFVMDYINGIELVKHVSSKRFSEEDAQYILVDVVLAVEYLHKVGCIHHDIKLENILINDNGDCTLIDFGLAKVTNGKPVEGYDIIRGSPHYVAPELLKLEPYTQLIDCWSFGVVLYTMVLSQLPFDGKTIEDVFVAINACNLTFPDDARLSDDFKDLITNLLTDKVEKRYDIHKIKAHPWFKEYFSGNEGSCQTANVPVSSE